MSVLIACEESQIVTIEFRKLGVEAYSCDIIDCSGGHPEWHIKKDVFEVIGNDKWDAIIAFPPCTYLSNAGIRWFNEEKYGGEARERKKLRLKAMEFVKKIYDSCDIVAIENPVGWLNSHWRKPDQIIQPYQFGDEESKRTCLWLKGLPNLIPTKIVKPKVYGYFKNGPKKGQPIYGTQYCKFSKDRAKIRSKTFPGIAKAMANQWADYINGHKKIFRGFVV